LIKGVDGIIHLDDNNNLIWISHIILDEKLNDIKSKGLEKISQQISKSWRGQLVYKTEIAPAEKIEDFGLRPPQIGALFAIGSHWSLSKNPATIVMPTGTGKTETILALQVANQVAKTLVIVPSKALRNQIVNKFKSFGLLKELGILTNEATYPVVGIIKKRPKTKKDLDIFKDCNVLVSIISSVSGGTANDYRKDIADIMDLLVVDEAHHVAAKTWADLKLAFSDKPILQFTATPFRNDGKLVEGSVIYSYPLRTAQEDGYFKPISFIPIHEIDQERADLEIAKTAVKKLRGDIKEGKSHQLIARCKSKERATDLIKIYEKIASDLNPQLVHSELTDTDERIENVRSGHSKIVVCVNMIGEGVDIPALKIAAVHDKHQSLAVLLQFVGRITRKGKKNLGDATVIANIADKNISGWLEQLYSEDSDWNKILREMSSDAAKEHAEFIDFLDNSESFDKTEIDDAKISQNSLRPTFSTQFFSCEEFHPKRFHEGLPNRYEIVNMWINEKTKTLYFVTRSKENIKWTNAKEVEQKDWHLFVLHFDQENKLLYLASTNKTSSHDNIAKAVGAKKQINGEDMFRSLGGIGRLVFNNLGVTKHGRKNLSFAMYTGADVKQALSETEKKGSRKSNVSGYGWENGKQITIGCSHKGRVWSKSAGTIPQFIKWASGVGRKLIDNSIDTKSVISNVLIPEYVKTLPTCEVLSIDWPIELICKSEERVIVTISGEDYELFNLDIKLINIKPLSSNLSFEIVVGEDEKSLCKYKMNIKGEAGFDISNLTSTDPILKVGKMEIPLLEYFRDYPPLVRFIDLSELDGNILLSAEDSGLVKIPKEHLISWVWPTTIDIKKESLWKKGIRREDSIQWHTAKHYIESGFDIVFDDDDAGEAADLVCIKSEKDCINLTLIHCKFSGGAYKGKRVKDVVEVASQAVRSAKWPGKIKNLVNHLEHREKRHKSDPSRSRFIKGDSNILSTILRETNFKEIRPEIVIVQPGISKTKITDNQSVVLGAASAYLKQTLGIDLSVICSK
ncbi:DEAD/DEAH box helicase family protein, partial [Patescibacteria group bacterium]|nr:DEAD/DEAH box helicase family protein [Patescibacteria group bacterium]